MPERADNQQHPLRCEEISFQADGKALIDAVSLSFAASGITAIMGYNGAGKSLLLRLMHGMIAPTSGQVSWDGRAITDADRKHQAMVFQKPVLLRRTALANIEFALASRGLKHGKALQVLEQAGLTHLASRPARLLSGGEQQRLSVARALALNPKVLFLDEATASLDPSSTGAIEALIRHAAENGTKIILVTHDIGQAKRLADEIVFVHAGRIAEQSAADAFFTEPRSEAARAYLSGLIPNAHH